MSETLCSKHHWVYTGSTNASINDNTKRKENIMRLVQAIERMGALLGLPKHLTWRAEQDGRWWLTLSC